MQTPVGTNLALIEPQRRITTPADEFDADRSG
jgi:hypothetical protein